MEPHISHPILKILIQYLVVNLLNKDRVEMLFLYIREINFYLN